MSCRSVKWLVFGYCSGLWDLEGNDKLFVALHAMSVLILPVVEDYDMFIFPSEASEVSENC